MVYSFKAHVRQVWLSKSLEQNVGTLFRFSVGISESSPEGQKQIISVRTLDQSESFSFLLVPHKQAQQKP